MQIKKPFQRPELVTAEVKTTEGGGKAAKMQGRRAFLKGVATGALATGALTLGLSGCSGENSSASDKDGGAEKDGSAEEDGGRQSSELRCVDVHTHMIFIDPADNTAEGSQAAADELINRMDLAGIDRVILLAVTERLLWGEPSIPDYKPWTLDDLTKQNDVCLAAHERYPDRLDVFIGLDWRGFGRNGWSNQAVEQVTRAIEESGAKGIKFHIGQATTVLHLNRALGLADDHQFLGDDHLSPVLLKMWELGGIPLFHVGDVPTVSYPEDAPPFWDMNAATYQHFEQLLNKFPDRPFIVAHLGCLSPDLNPHIDIPGAPTDYTQLRTLLDNHPNLYADTAGINVVLSRIALSEEGAQSTRQLILDYPQRILFGTDFGPLQKEFPAYEIYHEWLTGPFGQTFTNSYYPGLNIWSLGLEGDVLQDLYYGNYERIRGK